jgi:hypothetical protein
MNMLKDPMTVQKGSSDRLPRESKEMASKLRSGKLHYVSAVNNNVVYRSTSWMLSKSGMFAAGCIVGLLYIVLVWLLGVGPRNDEAWLWVPFLVLLLLPRVSQWFRTIDYYGLPFSTIKRKIKSQRQRHPGFFIDAPK